MAGVTRYRKAAHARRVLRQKLVGPHVSVVAKVNESVANEICKCGHSLAQHVGGSSTEGCLYGMTNLMRRNGMCPCERFTAHRKAP